MFQQLERAVLLGGQRLGQGAPEPEEVSKRRRSSASPSAVWSMYRHQ
jgi:hypothetical protein